MAGQVVKLKRETLEACMTCPLCNKLLREATMISVCLHTFCRKCIYEKLSNEADCCPVCNIDIGCLPVEKLRPDHNLHDIRAKIFPLKRRKNKTPEITRAVAAPAKRKERSLSSLAVNAPKVSPQTGLTGRRTKAGMRKAASVRGCGFILDLPVKKEEVLEDHSMSSSSTESLNKTAQNKRQGPVVEHSSDWKAKEDIGNDVETIEGKVDLWTPLNCLVEAAHRTKSSKFKSQPLSLSKSDTSNAADYEFYSLESKAKKESPSACDGDTLVPKSKNKDHGNDTKVEDIKGGKTLLPGPVKRRRFRAASRKREVMSDGLCTSAQAMVDASVSKCNRRNRPIWFNLVASEDQKGDESLPQISSCYLRIRDAEMPVSFIQKYLVKKLDLLSEAEVEIFCRGHPLLPTLQLQNLVDIWFRTAPTPKKVPASVGSSAKDFVMVLSYCRKVQAS